MAARPRILVTLLGIEATEAVYELDGQRVKEGLAPLALARLLPEEQRPDTILALCTSEAKQSTLPILRQGADTVDVECVELAAGQPSKDVQAFVKDVAQKIPHGEGQRLLVDLTHGYRHLSVLTWMVTLYVSSLHGVVVEGAYYALLEKPPTPSPFLNLAPLLVLPRWVHAIEVLQSTGSSAAMARELKDVEGQAAADLGQELRELASAFLGGLPLEFGKIAHSLRQERLKSFGKVLRQLDLPLAEDLTERLSYLLKPTEFSTGMGGQDWKGSVVLDEGELYRQAELVDRLLEGGALATALRLMQEWVITAAVLQEGKPDKWLRRCERHRMTSGLHRLLTLRQERELRNRLSDEQREFAAWWEKLTELRNGFAHAGMRPQSLRHSDLAGKITEVCDHWQTLRNDPTLPTGLTRKYTRLLISPLGTRPGVLYSAIRASTDAWRAEPETLLVVCSPDSQQHITAAVDATGYSGEIHESILHDPFGGLEELDPLVSQAQDHLVDSDHVLANVTGGTTLLGIAAERLAAKARGLSGSVSRIALVDRRPPQEQEADPWQASEWLMLEGGSEVRHGR